MKTRNTKQKEILLREIEKMHAFFTAEKLHEHALQKDKRIGLATVYRLLKSLRKANAIHSYLCDGKLIYSKEEKSHCHFLCEETGKIIHFTIDSLDFLKDKVPGRITSVQIEVKGVCDKCLPSK